MRYVNVQQADCVLLIVCTWKLHRMREQVPFLGNFDSLSRITMLLLGTTWRTDLYQHLLQHLGVTERLGLL